MALADPQRAFASFYKSERERSEKALVDILDILCKPGMSTDDSIDAIMARLEAHWGRYGEPGSLAPLGDAIADISGHG